MLNQEANRELFEEQVEIIFKAFNEESFSHQGKHYTLPPRVPYRGYQLEKLTLVPRPVHHPVECWQPIVSANPRGLDFMVRHGIKGAVGGGAATMQAGLITGYREAAARAGKQLALGEDLQLGLHFHLAKTREQAIREITPIYEEHVKMFAPLGFVPGLTADQIAAVARRGGWAAAGVPTVEHYMDLGSWFAGTPGQLVDRLKGFEERSTPGCSTFLSATRSGRPRRSCSSSFNGSPRRSCRHSNRLADREIFCSRIHAGASAAPYILAVARRARPTHEVRRCRPKTGFSTISRALPQARWVHFQA